MIHYNMGGCSSNVQMVLCLSRNVFYPLNHTLFAQEKHPVVTVMHMFLCSTPVPALRARARLWPLLVPVWRSSEALHSSSVTVEEPATTTPTPTASGSQQLKIVTCLRKADTRSHLHNKLDYMEHIWSSNICLSTSVQETCPNNPKSGKSPNTHKPLSGVHEEDINPEPLTPPFCKTACADVLNLALLVSKGWCYFLACVSGEGQRRRLQNSRRSNFTNKNTDTRRPFAPCRTLN